MTETGIKLSYAALFLAELCVASYAAHLVAGGVGVVIAMAAIPIAWILQNIYREAECIRKIFMNIDSSLRYETISMAEGNVGFPTILERLRLMVVALYRIDDWIRSNETEREEKRREDRKSEEERERQMQEHEKQRHEEFLRKEAERERAANVARFCAEFLTEDERRRLREERKK